MHITIRFFASLKEALKTDCLTLELPSEVQTLGDLRIYLATRDANWAQAFAPQKNIRAAQALEMVSLETLIQDGAEIAFFPPVTGG
jgi:sulfur-carrier protein